MHISDFNWNKDQVQSLYKLVRECAPTLLYGPSGCGKTSSVYAVAEEMGFRVFEVNGSDDRGKTSLAQVARLTNMKSVRPIIYLIDEADGISDQVALAKLVESAHSPLVLTCNKIWELDDSVKNRCQQIKFLEPPLAQVVNTVRQEGLRKDISPKFENVSSDFRASLLSALNGGQKHTSQNIFEKVEGLLKRGTIPPDIDDSYLIWCMSNASKFYYGRSLYEFIQLLCEIDLLPSTLQVDRWALIANFPSRLSGRVSNPTFFQRARVLSSQRRNGS